MAESVILVNSKLARKFTLPVDLATICTFFNLATVMLMDGEIEVSVDNLVDGKTYRVKGFRQKSGMILVMILINDESYF